jgi:hypothetical protein
VAFPSDVPGGWIWCTCVAFPTAPPKGGWGCPHTPKGDCEDAPGGLPMKPRRELRPITLRDALLMQPGARIITMAVGQWDPTLSAAYEDGWILLELDEDEVPVRAYRKTVQ